MAGEDRAVEEFERLVEALVGQVGHVLDHPDLVHDLEQLLAAGGDRSGAGRAVRVLTWAVMGETDHPQAVVEPAAGLLGIDDRVAALHQQDVADRRRGRVGVPLRLPPLQVGGGADHAHDPLSLELAVERELALRLGVGVVLRAEVDPAVQALVGAGEDGREDEAELAGPEIGDADSAGATTLGGHALGPLNLARLMRAELEVAVPEHRIHSQIKVSINSEHRSS